MDDNQPFSMLNALWFKPDGGAEKYREYQLAAHPFAEKYGATASDAFVPVQSLIGEFDADLMFFIHWPSFEVFQKFLADPGYQATQPLREEAITKSLLIRCNKVEQ